MDWFAALGATWPAAATARIGPWTLRCGDGGGSRVSAATLDGTPPVPQSPDPTPAEAAMRARGARPLFMVRGGEAALDADLARRGYAAFDATVLLAGRCAELAGGAAEGSAITCEAPLACMAEIWAAGGVGPARLRVMDRAAGPRTWLLGRLGDRPAGVGFVACHGGVAMLHALEVAPVTRRRGLGAGLTRAAAAWAAAQGAETLALAVTRANAPARALYAGLGLAEVAEYHYRIAPQAEET